MSDDAAPGADDADAHWPDRVRAHVFVTGRVQGVGFRATTRRTARDHGVDGWVQNLDDGRVEAVFEGAPDEVDALVAFCETGPRAARVERVDEEREPPRGVEGFEVRR